MATNNQKPLVKKSATAPIPKWLVPGLFLGLIAWGVYLAIGAAYSGHNVWRGVVVIACFALFLGWFWGLQWLYQRRREHK
jgi:hypothetical protein